MVTRKSFVALAIALVVLTACGGDGVRLRSDHRSDYDFSAVHRMALMPLEPDAKTLLAADPLVLDRLRGYVMDAFTARGFEQVPEAEADVLVSVLVDVQGRVDVVPYGYSYGMYDPLYDRRYYGYQTIHYEEGTLLIDLIDRSSRAVVWRGSAQRRLGRELDEEALRAIVERVLAAYPPETAPAAD